MNAPSTFVIDLSFRETSFMSKASPIRLFAATSVLAAVTACAVYADGLNGDPVNGERVFRTNSCPACHGVRKEDTSMVGPSLFGIVGRQAGTSPSLLGASENLKEYGVIWTAETLDEFLADPNAKLPGTPMTGILTDPQQRADVIAYLATLKE